MSNKVADRVDELLQELDFNAQNSWLGLGNISKVKTKSPLDGKEWGTTPVTDRVIALMQRPEYLPWVCETFLNWQPHPFQSVIIRELWLRAFPMLVASRGASKTSILGVYAVLRALLDQGSKVLLVGSAFRQAKGMFDGAAQVWYNSPMLRNLVGASHKQGPRYEVDRCSMGIGDSTITAIPLGNGEKVRGLRASHLLIDEFKSVPLEIVENVVFGFAAVAKSPLEKVKEEAYKQYLIKQGFWTPAMDENDEKLSSNQTVIAGTAWYAFSHFCQYYKRYKGFIHSRGDPKKYKQIFGTDMPANFNWKDFSVVKLSHDMLPDKFMDDKTLARTKATVSEASFRLEYGAVFVTDSDGFFRRSLVESCVVGRPGSMLAYPSCGEIFFKAVMRGRKDCKYVIAADPASQRDNFAICVLEVWPDHRRLVYCWTSRKSEYEAAKKKGLTEEKTFYSFCARKIRSLIALFTPCERLSIDSQGGGIQIAEALNDTDKLTATERMIYPILDPEGKKKKDTDDMAGDHILELVSFADANWTGPANHGLKKDFEDKFLLFPFYDPAEIELALELDKESGRLMVDPVTGDQLKLTDTLEDCVENIEDLKDELAIIVHSETGAGREKWDVPEKKSEGSAKGRLRKDRYSALLIANAAARQMHLYPEAGPLCPPTVGGAAHLLARGGHSSSVSGPVPVGPAWWVKDAGSFAPVSVRRGIN